MNTAYQVFAEGWAAELTETLSTSNGSALRFDGYARGPNIFIEAADAVTVRWAAIKNPIGSPNGYLSIRRSYLSSDPEPRFELFGFTLPKATSESKFLSSSPHSYISRRLKVSFEAVQELVNQNQIWVGASPRIVSQNDQIKNIDAPTEHEYQKDYEWVENPRFYKSYPHIVARLGYAPRLG
jgi:hypothetical protein